MLSYLKIAIGLLVAIIALVIVFLFRKRKSTKRIKPWIKNDSEKSEAQYLRQEVEEQQNLQKQETKMKNIRKQWYQNLKKINKERHTNRLKKIRETNEILKAPTTESDRKQDEYQRKKKLEAKSKPKEQPKSGPVNDHKGYYKILGLKPGASIAEVNKAYRKKAKTLKAVHIEADVDDETMAEWHKVLDAHAALGDEKTKRAYDNNASNFEELLWGLFAEVFDDDDFIQKK